MLKEVMKLTFCVFVAAGITAALWILIEGFCAIF